MPRLSRFWSRAPGRTTAALLLAAGLLFVLSIGVSLQRAREQLRLEAGSQRVSIWFSTQALVEMQRFRVALLRFDRGDPGWDKDRLLERYEILLSRLPLLNGAEEATTRSVLDHGDVVQGLQAALEQVEPDVIALRPGDVVPLARIDAVAQEGDLLLTRLNLALHSERRRAVEEAKASARHLSLVFQVSLGGLLLAALLLLLLIARAARRAVQAERTLRVLVDALPVGVAAFDEEGRIVLVNDAYLGLARLNQEAEALGRRPSELGAGTAVEEDIARVLSHRTAVPPQEATLSYCDGTARTLMVSTAPVFAGNGALLRVVRVALDVTEQRAADRRIRHLAEHDTLTDLPNRLLFGSHLKSQLVRAAPGRMVAVHCIDLDHFKEVNDSLGHPVGDQLLLAASARMRGALRDGDMLARLGGDEFAVIQPNLARQSDARILAERLTELLGRPYRLQGYTLRAGASIGTALAPEHGMTVEALLSRADIALYRAKAGGRGRAVLFSMEQEEGLRERRRIEEELRQALSRRELSLAYQPKFRITDGRIEGCEALLRWHHPEMGMVSPGLFIPVAEETGLIHPITQQVLDMACRQAMTWRAQGLDVPVAVNLSAGHFGAEQGVRLVEEALAATGCDPALLEVEVTEGVFLRSAEAATRSFKALRGMGVRVALDDFGTGYSSLGYLQHLPFDVIKVDRTFIAGLEEAGPGRRIVDAIVRLAHGLGAEVVAEGVETPGQLATLRQLGCDKAQGFLLGRPMPPCALAEMAAHPPERPEARSAA
ncbi:putative bifunctional diguanylate cyclase/phosphodiesterase [Falsiroseomonas tokyonensis]|uniref:Bifunctional diguanylate cyclase/phosphodiesterase n=1 Tax=Falsiroseomonas tokyonensis TaxID=430521 RepID=A0ABV7BX71_9PROT|nr:GGDEF and EAL domain-containing protein [Falsiroseomonas tokyonensis]MBU8539244.1 EAL domain-containing protein [Falsiroseomonas tokyonensis]